MGKGLKLTPAGRCQNCGAVVYRELQRTGDDSLCPTCEEQLYLDVLAETPDIFERTGGRLPTNRRHCSESCCRQKYGA